MRNETAASLNNSRATNGAIPSEDIVSDLATIIIIFFTYIAKTAYFDQDEDLEAGISFVNEPLTKNDISSIYSTDEYLEFPPHLSTQSSPIRQRNLEEMDCPHLLKGFAGYTQHQNNIVSSTLTSPNTADSVKKN